MIQYISFKVRILLGFLAVISLMAVISASNLINLSNTERDLTVTVSGFKTDEEPAIHRTDAAAVAQPEFNTLHHHRGHKEHIIWDTRRIHSNNALHNHGNSSATKSKPQLLAVANSDWEEF